VATSADRWVARLMPTPGTSIDALLLLPVGLDVWERHGDVLVVAASETQLSELERRRLAKVERLSTVAEFEVRARRGSTHKQEGSTG
jgi:ribose 1,5-bisphosphokinase PhnN